MVSASSPERPTPGSATRVEGPPTAVPPRPRPPADGPKGEREAEPRPVPGGWRALLAPARSSSPGVLPAGTVVIVMVLALVGAGVGVVVVDRGSSVRTPSPEDVAAIEAGAGARSPAGQPTIGRPGGRAVPTGPDIPRLRAPTPDHPLRLWVGGDAIAEELAAALTRLVARTGLFEVERDVRRSAGLSHPERFDWRDHLAQQVVPDGGGGTDPDVVVMMFGADDVQPGAAGASPDPAERRAWLDRYRRRVAEVMDRLRSPSNDRLVIWVGMPATETARHAPVGPLNAIFATEAATRPWIRYFDSFAFLADPFGRYAPALVNAEGRTEDVRADDGMGLTGAGGLRLARAVHARLSTLVDLRAAPLPADPSQSAPPSVSERSFEAVLTG